MADFTLWHWQWWTWTGTYFNIFWQYISMLRYILIKEMYLRKISRQSAPWQSWKSRRGPILSQPKAGSRYMDEHFQQWGMNILIYINIYFNILKYIVVLYNKFEYIVIYLDMYISIFQYILIHTLIFQQWGDEYFKPANFRFQICADLFLSFTCH